VLFRSAFQDTLRAKNEDVWLEPIQVDEFK